MQTWVRFPEGLAHRRGACQPDRRTEGRLKWMGCPIIDLAGFDDGGVRAHLRRDRRGVPLRRLLLCRQPRRPPELMRRGVRGVGGVLRAADRRKKRRSRSRRSAAIAAIPACCTRRWTRRRAPTSRRPSTSGSTLRPTIPRFSPARRSARSTSGRSQPGFKPTLLAYFDACSALGEWASSRLRERPRACRSTSSRDKLDRPMATLRLLHYPAAASRRDRRRRAHRLRQHHAARDRRRRRPRGAHARRATGSPRRRSQAPSSSTSAIA